MQTVKPRSRDTLAGVCCKLVVMQTVGYTSVLTCLKTWHGLLSSGVRGLCSASPTTSGFRVCVVGSGPAGLYTTDRVPSILWHPEILRRPSLA